MNNITINNINGVPPYTIFFCDVAETQCSSGTTVNDSIPPSITIDVPEQYQNLPELLLKIVDSQNCVYSQIFFCITKTPTPQTQTPTPSNTATPSLTPSFTPSNPTPTITPTITETPTLTPTNTVTPTYTPSSPTPTPTPSFSLTPTNTISPTTTPTLTQTKTPTSTPGPLRAYLFIEPVTGDTIIGSYMYNSGSNNFYGFSNGTQPSMSSTTFQTEMNLYLSYSGWTNGQFPSIISSVVAQTFNPSDPVDSFLNIKGYYNFVTTMISANTIPVQSWYTWIIPTSLTNNQIQTEIDLSLDGPNTFTTILTEPTIYSNTFNYTGNTIPKTTYRVYTSYPSSNFLLNNHDNIYFKGGTVS
jgi:hypothetical protein